MTTFVSLLLVLHIGAGFIALGAGLVAAGNKIFNRAHRWHVRSGRVFFVAMCMVFITALPLSILRNNVFLLLIAIFSFYLALSGWCHARNREGTPQRIDWIRAIAMLLCSALMASYGMLLLSAGNNGGTIMLAFGIIGALLGFGDVRIIRAGGLRGPERIARHLTMMLAATIATITAFLVVNFVFNPALVLWLAPTVVIVPLIVVMSRRVRHPA
ncbi:hypothetical protein [Dokdonella sp.]|uniref:hypothetical protein n=1 Tax=Dokdonella sp. TaxID=2291710 RepID=UPI003C45B0C3